jgi:uncharacterized membrane protein YfcA
VTALVVSLVALGAAGLTFFSGFGLGTLLLPAFALFFPIEVAVAATAVVHLANNLFKLGLVGRAAAWGVVLRFGLPAAIAAGAGAWILGVIAGAPPLARYDLAGRACEITPVKLLIAALMMLFAIVELSPRFERLRFGARWIPLGGALSGFFGGLSGHQGAFRSAFLVKSGLSKQAFVASGVACAVIVDLSRLAVYGRSFLASSFDVLRAEGNLHVVWIATAAAFAGSFAGSRLVSKVTMRGVQTLVGVMLVLLAIAVGAGLV